MDHICFMSSCLRCLQSLHRFLSSHFEALSKITCKKKKQKTIQSQSTAVCLVDIVYIDSYPHVNCKKAQTKYTVYICHVMNLQKNISLLSSSTQPIEYWFWVVILVFSAVINLIASWHKQLFSGGEKKSSDEATECHLASTKLHTELTTCCWT